MKTLKIEREVTKEDVYVKAGSVEDSSEIRAVLEAAEEVVDEINPYSPQDTYLMFDGVGNDWVYRWYGAGYEISIPQLAELLGVEYPLKPKLEAGKWYHYNGWLLCYVRHDYAIIRAYGINLLDGEWWDEDQFGGFDEKWIPASDTEVKAALIAEARKRGFKAGVEINNSEIGFRDNWRKIEGGNIEWDGEYLDFGIQSTAIFYNGKWAEVREEEKKLPTLEELIAEAKSKITVKTESYPCWVEGTREIEVYRIGGRKYTAEKLAIIGYIAERLWEESL